MLLELVETGKLKKKTWPIYKLKEEHQYLKNAQMHTDAFSRFFYYPIEFII